MKANLLEQIQLLAHTAGEFLKDGANKGVSAFVDVNGMDE